MKSGEPHCRSLGPAQLLTAIQLCRWENGRGRFISSSFCRGILTSAQTDASLLDTAIRETSEELGVAPGQIEFLGRFAEPEVSYKGFVVWPMLVSAFRLSTQASRIDGPRLGLHSRKSPTVGNGRATTARRVSTSIIGCRGAERGGSPDTKPGIPPQPHARQSTQHRTTALSRTNTVRCSRRVQNTNGVVF